MQTARDFAKAHRQRQRDALRKQRDTHFERELARARVLTQDQVTAKALQLNYGTDHDHAFWRGFNGQEPKFIRRGGTIYAAYRAGKQFAKEFSRYSSC